MITSRSKKLPTLLVTLLFPCITAVLGASTVGTLPGDVTVDNGGRSNYSIPIDVPPGTGGMAPTLALNYSSGGGNGPLGVGWSISGLSAISRTASSYFFDDLASGIRFNQATDRYSLDGQRLIWVEGSAYGASDAVYRTSLESFNRITSTGTKGSGPASLTLQSKSGLISHYGDIEVSPDSRIEFWSDFNKNGVVDPDETHVHTWLVSKIEDTLGNYMTFHYEKIENVAYLTHIEYSGNTDAGLDPYNEIRFIYENRPDVSESYLAGTRIRQTKRLKEVQIWQDTDSSSEWVSRKYAITYDGNNGSTATNSLTGRSRLESVQLFSYQDGQAFSMPATVFDWSDRTGDLAAGASVTIDSSTNLNSRADKTFFADLDGDGKQEIVVVDKADTTSYDQVLIACYSMNGTSAPQQIGPKVQLPLTAADVVTAVGDVDSDGVDDLIVCRNFTDFYIYKLTPAGLILHDEHTANMGVSSLDEISMGCVDVDYDGKNEIVIIYAYPNANVDVFVFDEVGTSNFEWRQIFTTHDVGIKIPDARQNDINGDGIFDLVVFPNASSGSTRVRLGSLTAGKYSGLFGNQYHRIGNATGTAEIVFPKGKYMTTDFNEDGYTDIVAISEGSNGHFHVKKYTNLNRTRIYSGYTYYLYDEGAPIDTGIDWDGDYTWFLDDVTDDGKPDLGLVKKNIYGNMNVHVLKATADSFSSSPYLSHDTGKDFNSYHTGITTEDYDGDGVSDMVVFHADSPYGSRPSMIIYAGEGNPGDMLTSATNGLGETSVIEYSNLVDPDVYWKEDLTSFPVVTRTTTMSVVKSVVRSDGVGGDYQSEYAYSDARFHLQGLGFLGFESMVSYDPQVQVYEWKHLEHAYPMMGMSGREEKYFVPQPPNPLGDITDVNPSQFLLMSKITNTNIFDAVAGGTLFAMTVQSIDKKWDLRNDTQGGITLGNGGSPYLTITSKTWFDRQLTSGIPALPSPSDPAPDHGDYVAACPTHIDYGDIIRTEVAYTADGQTYTEITENEYADTDSSSWLLGRLLFSKATQKAPGQADEVRTTAFVYQADSGLIAAEVEEPDPALVEDYIEGELTDYLDLLAASYKSKMVVYNRDSYGNILTEQVHFHDLNVNSISDPSISIPVLSSRTIRNIKTNHFRVEDKGRYPWKVTNFNGDAETFTYDPATGAVLTQTGPNGSTTRFTYDAFGRTTREDRADGTWSAVSRASHTTALPNHSMGNRVHYKVTTTGPESPTSITYYDSKERPLRAEVESADGRWIRQDSVYNALGQVTQASEKYFSTTTPSAVPWTYSFFDKLGRLQRVTAPDGTKTFTFFRGLEQETISNYVDGVFSSGTPSEDQSSVTRNNAKGDVAWTEDAAGSRLTHTYFANGDLKNSSSTGLHASGTNRTHTVQLWYDARGNKVKMNDPDMGIWRYATNALGQLRWQKDAKGQITKLHYDELGRMIKRENADGTSEWGYYTSGDSSAEGAWIGSLRYERFHATGEPTGVYENRRSYYYDHLGRLYLDLYNADHRWFYTYNRYDGLSRLKRVDYFWRPESVTDQTSSKWHSFGVEYTFNSRGFTTSVTDSTGYEWWSINDQNYDQEGRATAFQYGNLTTTQLTYDPQRPILTDSLVTHLVEGTISELQFEADRLGNFTGRWDEKRTNYEHFKYDSLNRLKEVQRDLNYSGGTASLSTAMTLTYDIFGNVKTRTGVGTYSYGTSRTHAVTAAGSHAYQYDANGNIGLKDGSDIEWTSFNKPTTIASGLDWSLFRYDANQSRTLQVSYDASVGANGVKKKVYFGPFEQEFTANPTDPDLHEDWDTWNYSLQHTRVYISTPTGVVGTLTHDASAGSSAAALKKSFFHYDHLGSIVEITGENGSILESLSYDPWGQRRNADTFAVLADPAAVSDDSTDRGFTGHEMLDNLGLVHMNARIYDPLIGRFLSPDSVLQFPNNLQSYDRYQYVLNNPLSFSDPSGHIIPVIVGIALVASGYAAEHVIATIIIMAIAGAADAAIRGAKGADIFKAGLMSAAITAVSMGIGTVFDTGIAASGTLNEIGRAAAHGLSGGVFSELQGGDFGSGFAAGFVGSAAGSAMEGSEFFGGEGPGAIAKRTTAVALVGGTTAEIGGGKFANGAMTAAVQHLFNQEAHRDGQGRDSDAESAVDGESVVNYIKDYASANPGEAIPITRPELEAVMRMDIATASSYKFDEMSTGEFLGSIQGYKGDGTFYQFRNYDFAIGGKIVGGSDINYYFQGFAAAARGGFFSRQSMLLRIEAWNYGEFFWGEDLNWGVNRFDPRNVRQAFSGEKWANYGYDFYKENN